MSGAHRIVKPPRAPRLVWLLVPVRLAVRYTEPAWRPVAAGCRWLAARAEARFDNRDPFEPDTETSVTSPDSIPAELAAAELAPAPAVKPLRLTPDEAAAALHTEHPHLPWQVLEWRINGDIHGQVRSLDCTPDQMRSVINLYAEALNVDPREDQADEGRTVLTATGEYAGVLFIVSAVFISADVVPLRVYDQAAGDETLDDTLTTQLIPERVLAEVLGR